MGRPQDGDRQGADAEQERQDVAEDPGSTLVERIAAFFSALLIAAMIPRPEASMSSTVSKTGAA
jgi:hypothetical protein